MEGVSEGVRGGSEWRKGVEGVSGRSAWSE